MLNLGIHPGMEAGQLGGENLVVSVAWWTLYYTFITVFAVAVYIFQSYGMYKIARRRGLKAPWLAWVPMACLWTLGDIADSAYAVWHGKRANLRGWLIGLAAVTFVGATLSMSFYVGVLVGVLFKEPAELLTGAFFTAITMLAVTLPFLIALAVLEYIAFYRLYKSCRPQQATLYTVLTILCDVLLPFLVFACRDRDDGLVPAIPQQTETPEAPLPPEE